MATDGVAHLYCTTVTCSYCCSVNDAFDKTGIMILSPKLFFSHGKLYIAIFRCHLYNGISISVDHDFLKKAMHHEILSYEVQIKYDISF